MDKELFNYYKSSLVNGLCNEYKGYWQAANNDKEKLIKLALSQQALPHVITYCENGLGLSKDYLMTSFKDYINGYVVNDADDVKGYTYSLYVGKKGQISVTTDVLAMLWCDVPQVQIKATTCPILYVGAKSDIHIVCDGYNMPRIYMFGESHVTLDDVDENSQVVIYKYSDRCKVDKGKFCLGKVNEFNKDLRL